MHNNSTPDNKENAAIHCLHRFFSILIQNQDFYMPGDTIESICEKELIHYTLASVAKGYELREKKKYTVTDLYIKNTLISNSLFVVRFTPADCPTNTDATLETLNIAQQPIRFFFMLCRSHNIDPIECITVYILSKLAEHDDHQLSPKL